ncbi:hypothetical protein GGTG_05953 [Gaeumannomyces tritici R3-111a-1]|uniref:Uncharacterized protein n=1 Tax=Gaeumannomyces tritici (strain R3-111a-1) TaxID=644352 RepID=J3NXE7_GAET3|nr:hypothetical protein GGTG_05953 [Gaeumannomyces tritici R3-111a-1]EJT76029.1 hypothetical protein GGTG_05953 [Gaeumannomyces tritici R3-111a-1]
MDATQDGRASSSSSVCSPSSSGFGSGASDDGAIDPRTGIDMQLPRSAPGLGRFAGGCCMMRASFALYSVVPGMSEDRLEDLALHLSGEAPRLVPRYVHHCETIDLMDPGEPLPPEELDELDEEVDAGGDGNGNGGDYFGEAKIFGEATARFAPGAGGWGRGRAGRKERIMSAAMIDPLDESFVDAVVGGLSATYKRAGVPRAPPPPGSGVGSGRRANKMVEFFLGRQQGNDEAAEGPAGAGDGGYQSSSKLSPSPTTAFTASRKLSRSGWNNNGASTSGASRRSSVMSHGSPLEQQQKAPSRPGGSRRQQAGAARQQQQQRRPTSTGMYLTAGAGAACRRATLELVRVPRPPEDDKFWRPPPLVRPATLTPLLGAVGSLRVVLLTHMASEKDPRPSRHGGPDNLAIVPWAFLVVFRDELIDDDDDDYDGNNRGGGRSGMRLPGSRRDPAAVAAATSPPVGSPAPMMEPMAEAAAESPEAAAESPEAGSEESSSDEEAAEQEQPQPQPQQQQQEEEGQQQERPRGPHSLMVVYGDVAGLALGTDRTVPIDCFFFHPKFTQVMLSAVLLGHRSLMDAKVYYDVDGENYDEELCYDLEHW